MTTKNRKYSAADKLTIVLQLLSGRRARSVICRENGISEGLAHTWRNAALSALFREFSGQSATSDDGEQERAHIAKLIASLGEKHRAD